MRLSILIPAILVFACTGAHALVDSTALFFDHVRNPANVRLSRRSEIHCLALNIYHEARGESVEGRLAVAAVTMNRVRDERFPDRVCEVVWQPHQFSWTHDGRSDRPEELEAWKQALRIARATYGVGPVRTVGDATFFHADHGRAPYWTRSKQLVRRIGKHLFYEG